MDMIGDFIAGFSHEIRNPMTAIKGYAAVLKKQIKVDGNSRLAAAIEGLSDSVAYLQDVINSFSSIALQNEEKSSELSISEVVNRALSISRLQVSAGSIEIKDNVSNALPQVYGNKDQLVQVFLNLIINAIQAMDNGGCLTISGSVDDDERYLKVTVKDTGKGIDPSDMPNIFKAFYSTKKAVKGMGLGLSISYGIIQRHSGFIDVESTPGEGSTFIIKLPTVYNGR